jgi:large subunit ribosomal protein L10
LKREEKEKQVAWLREQFLKTRALFLTDFAGLTVSEMTALRSELRSKGIALKVLKNTLTRLAYQGSQVAVLESDVAGPRAAAWTETDENVPAMAKVLTAFAKAHPKLKLVRGVLNGKLVQPSEMETLASLPSREVLLGRLLGTMIAPVGGFVNTLAAVPRSFLTALKAIQDQKSAAAESNAG